jgi:hypothetical protein
MKLNSKEFEKLLDDDSDEFEFEADRQKVNEKINKLLVKEKHADNNIYANQDPKRKFKKR